MKEQFYAMYTTPLHIRKVFRDFTHRAIYKHWNNWCFKCSEGLYVFDKGYDEDWAKYNIRYSGDGV